MAFFVFLVAVPGTAREYNLFDEDVSCMVYMDEATDVEEAMQNNSMVNMTQAPEVQSSSQAGLVISATVSAYRHSSVDLKFREYQVYSLGDPSVIKNHLNSNVKNKWVSAISPKVVPFLIYTSN